MGGMEERVGVSGGDRGGGDALWRGWGGGGE